ncbi:MAG TPA: ABC transporter substrate-binding protein, partial [Candidatus Atribacteria bacterium]|nr:ABC transporter substrate-binding protein [Candidatus Atribacteria bacterium]
MRGSLVYKIFLLTIIITLFSFLFAFVGFSTEKPVYGGKLTVALPAEPPGLDPTSNTAAVIDRVVYNNVYEGLVKIDRYGKIVPALAESWEISKDGLTYTFHLRKGVKFHDGSSFSATDVKYTIERNTKEDTKNAHPEFFRVIKQMKVLDEYTIQFKLGEPNFMFLFNLARGDSVIVPEGHDEDLKSNPIGTGPFKFKQWARG